MQFTGEVNHSGGDDERHTAFYIDITVLGFPARATGGGCEIIYSSTVCTS